LVGDVLAKCEAGLCVDDHLGVRILCGC
jgi:hypothetical protein